MARPTKFTQERQDKIITALRAGHYRETAAAYGGISYETLRQWLKRAENPTDHPEYPAFRDAVCEAEAQAEVADLALIRRAASDGEWRAAAWRLERKHPERWGQRAKVEVEHSGELQHSHEVRIGADRLSIETLAAALARRAGLDQAKGAGGEGFSLPGVEVQGALLPSHGGMPPGPSPSGGVVEGDVVDEGPLL